MNKMSQKMASSLFIPFPNYKRFVLLPLPKYTPINLLIQNLTKLQLTGEQLAMKNLELCGHLIKSSIKGGKSTPTKRRWAVLYEHFFYYSKSQQVAFILLFLILYVFSSFFSPLTSFSPLLLLGNTQRSCSSTKL